MIKIDRVTKRFGAQVVLDGVSLDILDGEMMAIVGPSGTGKSVLLKIIMGLLPPDEGDVLIHGKSVRDVRTEGDRIEVLGRLGVLFQRAALFDSLTLLENVAFPLRYCAHLTEREIIKRARERLDDVNLLAFESKLPGEVSIAVRKRVGLARALANKPDIVLFDEPNTGLDPEAGQEIYDLIKKTHEEYRYSGIVVSHEIPEVFQVCKRVAMLYQGQIQLDAGNRDFMISSNQYVQQFMKGDIAGPIQSG